MAVSAAAAPIVFLAVRSRAGRAQATAGMVAGTLPWLWMALTPLPAERGVRMVPLRDLAAVLAGDPLAAFFQIGGNLLVFAAFGFFAVRRWPIGPGAVTGLAALGSVTIEALQYALALGRVSSVDDVLLNAAGAGLAALTSRRRKRSRRDHPSRRSWSRGHDTPSTPDLGP